MQFNIFYSWQSDKPNTKNFIRSCLNKAALEFNNFIIKIDSDSRESRGSENINEQIFSKIAHCNIFVADLTIINDENNERKTCNPNVLIELGYAIRTLGWSNIILLFDSEYGVVEDLPFDIRQNKIIKFNSSKKREYLISRIKEEIEIHLSDFKPAIYDYLYSEIDNIVISHLLEFNKMFYYKSSIKKRHDYTYLIRTSMEDLKNDIEKSTFLGFELFNNLSLIENDLFGLINKKENSYFLSEDINYKLSALLLSMKAISKFIIDTRIFLSIDDKSSDYKIVNGKQINPLNDDKLILLENIANEPDKGIVISAN